MPAPLRKLSAKSLPLRMTKEEKRISLRVVYPEEIERPRTRGECLQSIRPCPWAGCKYHLYLDVSENNGRVKINFPHLEISELTESCALDVADRGPVTLEETGEVMNLVRERVRQMEAMALAKAYDAKLDMEDPEEVDRDELPELPRWA